MNRISGLSHVPLASTDDTVREVAEMIVTAADLNESLFKLLNDTTKVAEILETEFDVASSILRTTQKFQFLSTRKIDLSEIELHMDRGFARKPAQQPRTLPC